MQRGRSTGRRIPLSIDFSAEPAAVVWQPADGARFTEPFFDDSAARMRHASPAMRARSTTPLSDWSDAAPAILPAAVILHTSRSGSTLVSRMLASLPDHLVVSEARVFDDILRARRDGVDGSSRESWLRHAVAAFADSQAVAPRRIVLKLDCWHVFEIARLRVAFPGVPLLFVHRDPLEILVSLMRRPSYSIVRDTVTPGEIGITREERDALSLVEHAAAVIGAFFREAARQREHLVPVPYASLPSLVWSGLPGLAFSAEEIERLRRAAEQDAKEPRRAFVPDADRKRAEAAPDVREACTRWCAPAYEAWLSVL